MRVTAVALAVALVVVTVSLVGSAAAERDVIVRRGRSTSHRLDTIDGIAHAHEVSEPETAPSGRTIGDAVGTSSEQPHVDSPAVLIPASPVIGRFDAGAVRIGLAVPDTARESGVRRMPGRSPPTV